MQGVRRTAWFFAGLATHYAYSTRVSTRTNFKALVVTVTHFFGSFAQLFRPPTDQRVPARLTQSLPASRATGVLMLLYQW
jgi:hypothetical protein